MKLWNNLKMHFVLGCYDIMTYKLAWGGGGVNKYFKKFIDKNGS